MDRREFVRETLVQIVEGSLEAGERLATMAEVNPKHLIFGDRVDPTFCKSSTSNRPAQIVRFDVAVYASEEKEKGGKAQLRVFTFSAGGGFRSEASSGSELRIQFSVPLLIIAG